MDFDVFISHAGEDKVAVARPLADHLQRLGLRVWLDELEITLGDSLRRKIDQGLSKSRYGIVILSPAFLIKEWPNKELDGLVAREDGSEKVILPIWHNVGRDDIVKFSPILADKVAVSTSRGLSYVADRVKEAIQPASSLDLSLDTVEAESESDFARRMRMEMLSSSTSRDLKRLLYEVEGYLQFHPHSYDVHILRDDLEDLKPLDYRPADATHNAMIRPLVFIIVAIVTVLSILVYLLF